MEIERKYLLKSLPVVSYGVDSCVVEQGYFHAGDDVIRVRRCTYNDGVKTCFVTIKRGRGLVREEYEGEITEEAYEVLSKVVEKRLKKTRHDVVFNKKKWSLDVFDNGVVLAEVELKTADEKVEVPDTIMMVLVREVTGEDEFVNFNMAKG